MTCCKCKNPIEVLADMGSNGMCTHCYNNYMSEYREANRAKVNELSRESMRFKRWIAGGERKDDMGESMPKIRWY